MTDTYEQEGIAYCGGYVAGGYAGMKGISAGAEALKGIGGNTKGVSGAEVISKADRAKIDRWKFTPDDDLYLKYKDVYDNSKFFNQSTGDTIYPGMKGDVNIDGFVNGEYKIKTLQPGKFVFMFHM